MTVSSDAGIKLEAAATMSNSSSSSSPSTAGAGAPAGDEAGMPATPQSTNTAPPALLLLSSITTPRLPSACGA